MERIYTISSLTQSSIEYQPQLHLCNIVLNTILSTSFIFDIGLFSRPFIPCANKWPSVLNDISVIGPHNKEAVYGSLYPISNSHCYPPGMGDVCQTL